MMSMSTRPFRESTQSPKTPVVPFRPISLSQLSPRPSSPNRAVQQPLSCVRPLITTPKSQNHVNPTSNQLRTFKELAPQHSDERRGSNVSVSSPTQFHHRRYSVAALPSMTNSGQARSSTRSSTLAHANNGQQGRRVMQSAALLAPTPFKLTDSYNCPTPLRKNLQSGQVNFPTMSELQSHNNNIQSVEPAITQQSSKQQPPANNSSIVNRQCNTFSIKVPSLSTGMSSCVTDYCLTDRTDFSPDPPLSADYMTPRPPESHQRDRRGAVSSAPGELSQLLT